MSSLKSIEEIGQKIYKKITEPKLVKLSTTIALIVASTSIIIGIIVAIIGPPGGYNPVDNYISDLGGSPFTPIPYFLDIAAIVSGILLVPTLFYMEKLLVPLPENEDDLRNLSRMRTRLGSIAFVWMLTGLVGWFFVGVFSEDRTTVYGLHFIASIVCFSGLAMGGFFFGLVITFYDTPFPKSLGLYAVIVPSIACAALLATLWPIIEWIYFFSVFGWMIPGFVLLIKQIDELEG